MHPSRALPLLAFALTSLAACAGGPTATPGPRVMLVQDDEFVLTGTTDTAPSAPESCKAGAPKHYVKLIEPLKAKITLRGTNGASPLAGAVMSVTNVDSKKTVCVAMKGDGGPAVLPAELGIGTYAISVEGADEPRRYEILWEQL